MRNMILALPVLLFIGSVAYKCSNPDPIAHMFGTYSSSRTSYCYVNRDLCPLAWRKGS
jgi:hypothetical protein